MPVAKSLPVNVGNIRDSGSIPGSGRFPGGGPDNPVQYSGLENPLDRGAWWATVQRVAKSWTRLKGLSTHTSMCTRTPGGAVKGSTFFSLKLWAYLKLGFGTQTSASRCVYVCVCV